MEIHSCWGSLDHGKYLCGGTCVREQRLEDDSGVCSPLLCVHQACMVPLPTALSHQSKHFLVCEIHTIEKC